MPFDFRQFMAAFRAPSSRRNVRAEPRWRSAAIRGDDLNLNQCVRARRRLSVRRPARRREFAFTLLEVILALAILAGALAALGEVLRLSGVNANAAADLSRAQLLAASKMSEIKSGVIELSVANRSPFELETTPRWVYSIDWEPTIEEDIIAVRVTVEQDLPAEKQPIQYSLVRWMIDPDVQLAAASESTSAATSDSATSGSTAPASGAGR